MGNVEIITSTYKGWNNCIELSNGIVDLIATTDVGPRIMRFGFVGDRNEFNEWEDQLGKTGGDEWRCYGGSRLWHGPEIGVRCYETDNETVEWGEIDNGIILKQKTEPWTKITKEMKVILNPDNAEVKFIHKLTNDSPWQVDLCIWVLTLLDKGGLQIIPRKKHAKGMLPK